MSEPRTDPTANSAADHAAAAGDTPDAWLGHALRHAPDASADAPPALSESILRSARVAVARPTVAAAMPGPTPWQRRQFFGFMSAWAWLARPPVAAGFASMMVATLVGVLWWGRPLDEALPQPPAPADATAPLAAERPAPAEPAPPMAATPAPAPAPTPGMTDLGPRPAAQARRADKAPAPALRDARPARAETSPQAGAAEAEPTPAPRSPAADPPATASATAPAATAATPESPQAAAAPVSPAARRRESSSQADAKLARAFADAAASHAAPLHDNAATGSLSSPTDTRPTARTAESGRAPLTALLAAVARQPERWRWQREGGGEPQAMTPDLQRWLGELDRATASRWRPTPEGTPRDGPVALRLLRDGVPQASVGFGSHVWIEASGDAAPNASTATLPAGSIEALRNALDEATR